MVSSYTMIASAAYFGLFPHWLVGLAIILAVVGAANHNNEEKK